METPVRPSLQSSPPVITKVGQDFFNVYGSLQRETGRMVPPRKSLGLAASRLFAPYLSILEIREPMVALVRIVGTAIVNRTHIDNTGKDWFELFPAEAREPIWRAFRHMLDTPRGSLVFAKEEYQRSVVIEVLSYPFADGDGRRALSFQRQLKSTSTTSCFAAMRPCGRAKSCPNTCSISAPASALNRRSERARAAARGSSKARARRGCAAG